MNNKKKYNRRKDQALAIMTILVIVCVAVMAYLLYDLERMHQTLETKGPDDAKQYEDPTLENSLDTLILMEQETWAGLSENEKIAVLQKIADIEQVYLGLPDKMTVKSAELSEGILAEYMDSDRSINVDRENLLQISSYTLCEAILHEAYHSLEFRMVDVYDDADEKLKQLPYMRTAAAYKDEFNNYISCNKDRDGYWNQTCEIDSFEYAAERVESYISLITDAVYGDAVG